MTVRITLFHGEPEFLLVRVPAGESLRLAIDGPLDRAKVSTALAAQGVDYRITETVPGRWSTAIRKLVNDEKAEAGNKAQLSQAGVHSMLRSSNVPEERRRSEMVLRKQQIDARLREIKVMLTDARGRAATRGEYMPRATYVALTSETEQLKQESQSVQNALTALRDEGKGWRARTFEGVARRVLPPEMLALVLDAVDEASESGVAE